MVFGKDSKRLEAIEAELNHLGAEIRDLRTVADEIKTVALDQAKDESELAEKLKTVEAQNANLRQEVSGLRTRIGIGEIPYFPYPIPKAIESQIDWEKIGMRPYK